MGNVISFCSWRKSDPNLNDEGALAMVQHERSAAPSTQKLCIKAGQRTIEALQSATNFVPVPFAREALGVILTLIQVCEQVTALQSQLDDLKDHLCTLALIILQ
ncbi:hypothetical protein M413DRAFT_23126 [Hebeloma cylindrosporum]|uniref:Uncharacterized protein n=1 Tax=Hebeloma cylindrosporum TaxID=76867 RepID=A0A0C3CRR8_HEBCY|nr:hypothetical protein M413DRAFT_23126 [Hebeloma cylindrosporum h7]